jgi:hypothetical protein
MGLVLLKIHVYNLPLLEGGQPGNAKAFFEEYWKIKILLKTKINAKRKILNIFTFLLFIFNQIVPGKYTY